MSYNLRSRVVIKDNLEEVPPLQSMLRSKKRIRKLLRSSNGSRTRFCDWKGCRVMASFGPPGGNSHRCSTHKEKGYRNLIRRQCDQCYRPALFGPVGGPRQWCRDHAPDDAVDPYQKKCQELNCQRDSAYGPTKGNLIHCLLHRRPEDVIGRNRLCSDCSDPPLRAYWSPEGESPIRCIYHRLPTDVSQNTLRRQRRKR